MVHTSFFCVLQKSHHESLCAYNHICTFYVSKAICASVSIVNSSWI
uniref:Uncharacterized protein n=1 Tax=Anguilla anguilla TaxID=7936 RepID=A0A0E9TYA0_ANGAN